LSDLSAREKWSLAPLIVMIFWIGFYPATFLDLMKPSVDDFSAAYSEKLKIGSLKLEERFVVPPFDKLPAAEEAPAGEPGDEVKKQDEGAALPAHDAVLAAVAAARGAQ
jgi:hypothetical protein